MTPRYYGYGIDPDCLSCKEPNGVERSLFVFSSLSGTIRRDAARSDRLDSLQGWGFRE